MATSRTRWTQYIREFLSRVGNAGAVHLSLNGIDFGTMGGAGAVVEWRVTRL